MKIKKIYKEKYSGIVYNFHCTPNENYFSENMLVHNCYKSNTTKGLNMSFDTFKAILDKFPHGVDMNGHKHFFISQLAAGVDASCESNPDIWRIFKYCRNHGIIPNLTVASITDKVAEKIAKYCGACAVSRYSDKDVCYNTVDLLTNRYGLKYCNLHMLVSKGTKDIIWETLKDIKSDPRLKKLTAIVFLALKQKGRGITQQPLEIEEFSKIVNYCIENNISFGGDSCSQGKIAKSLPDAIREHNLPFMEPCEASCHSFYCDVEGKYFPCSFMANESGDWKEGIDIVNSKDFYNDIWNAERTFNFRNKVINCNNTTGGCCHFKV